MLLEEAQQLLADTVRYELDWKGGVHVFWFRKEPDSRGCNPPVAEADFGLSYAPYGDVVMISDTFFLRDEAKTFRELGEKLLTADEDLWYSITDLVEMIDYDRWCEAQRIEQEYRESEPWFDERYQRYLRNC